MLDFDALKKVPIIEVLARYGVKLRYRGDWGSAPCPLPTHKQGDKGANFTVNLRENYWRCFSESCNKANGRKGGDVINLVASLERCGMREAAEKLVEYKKPVPHIEKRAVQEPTSGPLPITPESKSVPDKGQGYMQGLSLLFDEVIVRREKESEDDFRKRVKKWVMGSIYESYKNGKTAKV